MRIYLTGCVVFALLISFGSRRIAPAQPQVSQTGPSLIAQQPTSASPWAKGGILVTEGCRGRLLLLDRATKRVVWESSGLRGAHCVATLPTGEVVVGEGKSVALIDNNGIVASRLPATFLLTTDIKPIEGRGLLVSDGAGRTVSEIDWNGNILWSVSQLHWPSESVRLESGNTLVADGTTELKEFDSRGELVRATPLKRWAAAVQRVANGHTLVGESGAVELLDAAGKRIWSRAGFKRATGVQELPDGEILVCDPDNSRVVILNASGDMVWERAGLILPWHAIYLR